MKSDRGKLERRRRHCLGWALSVLLPIAIAPGAIAQTAETQPTQERQSELVHLLRHDCGSCHGMTLAGGLGLPLTADVLGDRRDEDIAHVILNGVAGTPMPPWQALLSKSDALWLARHLRTGEAR